MAPYASAHRVKKPKAKWSMTVMMNARDLSRDDDFLSHLLVEHLGTDDSPLQVHKMDPSRRLPKHEPMEVLAIVKKYVVRRGGSSTSAHRVKRAVDALLELTAVKQYLHKRSTAQINAFATHASRYFELYLPTGSIEISHTSRYSHRTGKSELCILATTPLKVGQVISDLKGSLAHLTIEEDEELKKTDSRRRDGGIRRDFSVIHSNQKNKSHLFLGPARFVNHDCDHNVELFRDGRVITFRVIKPIGAGQEVTAHYGEGYFGKGNRHCLCQTCERLGRGGYTPEEPDSDHELEDDSSTDEETREDRIKAGLGLNAKGNPNERRTRRGVYAILPEEDTDDEDRVGATEAVAAQVPVQVVGHVVKDGKVAEIAAQIISAASASPTSNLTPLAFAPSALAPALSSEDTSLKYHDRRKSDASSVLTSLPESDKLASRPGEGLDSNIADAAAHLISSSSLSSITSAASTGSSLGLPTSAESVKPPSTPATSRMSTRSSTASQSKGKSKEETSSPSITPHAKEAKPAPESDKRALRSTRSTAALAENGKVQPKVSDDANQVPIARPIRQTRHSLPSASGPTKGSEPGPSDDKHPASGVVTKNALGKSQSKSAAPAVAGTNSGTQSAKKSRPNIPRCHSCSNELPHLNGVKSPRNAIHSCARCKRHLAIFSAPWPNRNPTLEALTSYSSESSSAETVIELVRKKVKGIGYVHEVKISRKYDEMKQLAIERPVKRRKTDSPLLHPPNKSIFHHADDQPRDDNGQFDRIFDSRKPAGYSQKNFSIPGGAQRSRAHRALSRERVKSLGSVASSIGTKRRWGDTFRDPELRALDRIRSRKRPWDDGSMPLDTLNPFLSVTGSRKTIRRVPSLPALPVAKPLAALCVRPTPNMFARNAWAASAYEDGEPRGGDDSSMETDSELTDLPEPESKPAPKIGQKRKREVGPSDSKSKIGRHFYMKDEKKPMPKGWVLVTDSSEENGEDEEDEERGIPHDEALKSGVPQADPSGNSQAAGKGGNTAIDADRSAFYLATGTDSSASTPSLAHTPSSRAASTPTQSSWNLVEDQTSVAPIAGKRAVVTYSLRRPTASRTPSTVLSTKRRKLEDDGDASLLPGKSHGASVGPHPETDATSVPSGRLNADGVQNQEASLAVQMASCNATPDSGALELELEDSTGLEDSPGPIAMLQALFSPPSGNMAKGARVSVAVADSEGRHAPLLANYSAQLSEAAVEVPDSDSKRAALEVSNIIHGTAFSYGHPDARTTWKPTYHFSELDGWDSDIETCL